MPYLLYSNIYYNLHRMLVLSSCCVPVKVWNFPIEISNSWHPGAQRQTSTQNMADRDKLMFLWQVQTQLNSQHRSLLSDESEKRKNDAWGDRGRFASYFTALLYLETRYLSILFHNNICNIFWHQFTYRTGLTVVYCVLF